MVTCTTPPFRAAVRLNSGVRAHMRIFLAALTFVCFTACATGPTSTGPTGCYSSTDATRYVRFYLDVLPSGTFTARLANHMSAPQVTIGSWSTEGNKLILKAIERNEAFKHEPTVLTWRSGAFTLAEGSLAFSGWSPLLPSSCEP